MIGIIAELAISWLLLWLFTQTNLEALGLLPSKNRLINAGIGLLLSEHAVYSIMY